ncbi:MAG TPA: hypothetical protein VD970_14235 [Acetobacteraceae bacterium]|nr:hypothetical protein [Acetobacteraceae bacterium]
MRRRDLLLAAALLPAACARRITPDGAEIRGHVLLLRGLANVFSTGMDDLAGRIAAAGFGAEVRNHIDWRGLAARVVAQERAGRLPRPFAVVGHSLGADDAILLAGAAGAQGVATDLLVTFDPVWIGTVPAGPQHVLNLFQSNNLWGRAVSPGPGFAGRIENRDLADRANLNHFNIEKDPALHAQVVAALEALSPPWRGPLVNTPPGTGGRARG